MALLAFVFRIESAGKKRGAGKGFVDWRNLDELTVNYYEMDIEFLFSTNPFTRDQSDGFSMIRPNLASTVELKKKEAQASGTYEFDLPKQFDNKNVLVEVAAGESSRSETWFANSMEVQVVGKRTLKCMLTEILDFKILEQRICRRVTRPLSGELGFLLVSKAT